MIRVQCTCGKTYDVPDDWAGSSAKCRCGQPIKVPPVAPGVDDLFSDEHNEVDISEEIPNHVKQESDEITRRQFGRRIGYALLFCGMVLPIAGSFATPMLMVIMAEVLGASQQPGDAELGMIGVVVGAVLYPVGFTLFSVGAAIATAMECDWNAGRMLIFTVKAVAAIIVTIFCFWLLGVFLVWLTN